ncbi:MAG: hypothetical protein IKI06_09465 [Prevotella sp.]|nr:hypothetical protein [Prevotella sp.]
MSLFSKFFNKDDDFGIIVSQNSQFDLTQVQRCSQILRLDIDNLLKPKPLLTQADPFLFVKGNTLYLFYESERSGEKGIIRMKKSDDLSHWSSPVTVLDQPFHLSFPFVFDYAGDVFMIPETQASESIRLYRGNKDLTDFTFERALLTQPRTEDVKFNFCDSHLLEKDGIFYLFTSVSYNWTYHLELYYTDDILNHDFVKHPLSPVYIGNDFGRSGGSIIHLDDNYYRISQDCSRSYGENVSIHRITALDKHVYKEELYKKDILEVGGKIYQDGGHQLNVIKYGDSYIYATDFRHVSWCWYQLYLRIKNAFVKK